VTAVVACGVRKFTQSIAPDRARSGPREPSARDIDLRRESHHQKMEIKIKRDRPADDFPEEAEHEFILAAERRVKQFARGSECRNC